MNTSVTLNTRKNNNTMTTPHRLTVAEVRDEFIQRLTINRSKWYGLTKSEDELELILAVIMMLIEVVAVLEDRVVVLEPVATNEEEIK